MTIKKATLKDVPLISKIHALSWKIAYREILPDSYLNNLKEDFWEPAFNKWIEEGTITVHLLYIGKQIAGCVSYGKSRDELHPTWGEIVSLYLLPEYFGKGYGKYLLRTALKELKEIGCSTTYLWVLKENKRARYFYEKNAFRETPDHCLVEIEEKEFTDIRYVFP